MKIIAPLTALLTTSITTKIHWASLTAVLVLSCLQGCANPRLIVKPIHPVFNAQRGPAVEVRIADARLERETVSIGYLGWFQERRNDAASEETPPAQVLAGALQQELENRGLGDRTRGVYQLDCKMSDFLLRWRNYSGMFSATDGWGYLDLYCVVRENGAPRGSLTLHPRAHRVFYGLQGVSLKGGLENTLWPELLGALVQQAAGLLNRDIFHLPMHPKSLDEGVRLLTSRDADEQYLGVYMLGISGDPRAIPYVRSLLGHPEQKVRRIIADSLGALGDRESVESLLLGFEKEHGNVKWALLKGILQTRSTTAFRWLRTMAPSITNDTLQEIAQDVIRHEPMALAPSLGVSRSGPPATRTPSAADTSRRSYSAKAPGTPKVN